MASFSNPGINKADIRPAQYQSNWMIDAGFHPHTANTRVACADEPFIVWSSRIQKKGPPGEAALLFADACRGYGWMAEIQVRKFAPLAEGLARPEYWLVIQTSPRPVVVGRGSGIAEE